MIINGITPNTPANLLLGAGAFFKDYDITKDTPATAAAKLIGATQGGGSFNAVPTVRQITVDGGKTNTKGLETIDEWVATMVANVKEVTVNSLQLALGASTVTTTTTPAGYKKIVGNEDFSESDYITNLTWVGTLKGAKTPVVIILKRALSLNGLNLNVSDKNEAVIPITVTAHYDTTDLSSVPFEIYYPTITAN